MPDPKDFMDDDHEFVGPYVRRKPRGIPIRRRRMSWFWNLAWYWRLLISLGSLFGIFALIIVTFMKNPFVTLGIIAGIVFLCWFLRLVTK